MISTRLNKYKFDNFFSDRLNDWLSSFIIFCEQKLKESKIVEQDIDLIFEIIIYKDDDKDNILYEKKIKLANGTRKKTLTCSESVIGNIIHGIIPFKDLDVGYLAEFSRTPKDYYNDMFLMVLGIHSHSFFNCNIIDTEEYEHQE
jgi:hypothetical protein